MTNGATRCTVSARFEAFDGHRSLVVRWQPPVSTRATALFLPAFGDEMNQTRRMMRLTAEALAEQGVASCLFDLYGTGDSSADFGEATVERWLADCRTMATRLAAEQPVPLFLIGCRLGVGLAARLSHMLEAPAAALIGWAPVLQGKVQLSGLLRVAHVARMQRGDGGGPDPKACCAAGQQAVLGGYPVSPALAEQLEAFDATGAPRVTGGTLIDVRLPVGDEPASPSEALRKRAAAWSEQGVSTELLAVAGPGFWNVADLVDVPQLVDASVEAVDRQLASVTA